jgi:quinol monooxygenase YgiN
MTTNVEANEPGCLSYQYFYSAADDEIEVFEM